MIVPGLSPAQIIGTLVSGAASLPASGDRPAVSTGTDPNVLALLAAVLAGQREQAAAPAEPTQQKGSGIVEAVVIATFLLAMFGTAGLGIYMQSPLTALAVLAFGLGVLASKFGTIVDFRFGSSWGSRQKDAWRPSAGQGTPVVIPPPLPLPAPEQPSGEPAAGGTGQSEPPSIQGVGPSTDPSTATRRTDTVVDGRPASIRYNNPGAQYPSAEAAHFGQLGYGVIGGGHKIALFPHPVNGAASNFDLLRRKYVGLEIGEAGRKWTGANGFGVPGYPDTTKLTAQMIDDPSLAIPFMQAIAKREAGKDSPLTAAEWQAAHAMFRAGSADAWLQLVNASKHSKRPTGADLVAFARKYVGGRYANVLAPKDDANYAGPFDCAELATYVVYQVTGRLYGCVDNGNIPSEADAYTGAWRTDAGRIGRIVTVAEAARTPGAFVLRFPPTGGGMGHIAISVGDGTTIEAKSTAEGIVVDRISGRRWDIGVLIPWVDYSADGDVAVSGPAAVYAIGQPNMRTDVVRSIQLVLKDAGYDPGAIDGEFGPKTAQAVAAYQRSRGLVEDGEVGPQTAAALGVTL